MSGEHSGVIQIENILILSVLKIFSELLVMRGKSKSPAQCQHNTYFRICGGGATCLMQRMKHFSVPEQEISLLPNGPVNFGNDFKRIN